MTRYLSGNYLWAVLVMGLLIGSLFAPHIATAKSDNPCHDLKKTKCTKSDKCSWIKSYKTKTGKRINSYCRKKPAKSAKKKSSAKTKAKAKSAKTKAKAKSTKTKAKTSRRTAEPKSKPKTSSKSKKTSGTKDKKR